MTFLIKHDVILKFIRSLMLNGVVIHLKFDFRQIVCDHLNNIKCFSPKTVAASLTLRVIIPGTSMELTKGMRPCLDRSP